MRKETRKEYQGGYMRGLRRRKKSRNIVIKYVSKNLKVIITEKN